MRRRVPNWDVALLQWAASVIGRPYRWGETDCGTLVREAHRLMYGEDLVPQVKPYRTKRQALNRHTSTGGVRSLLLELGAHDVPIALAQSGDVLCEPGDAFGACGMVVGRDVIWATVEDGVVRVPLRGRSGQLLRVPHG